MPAPKVLIPDAGPKINSLTGPEAKNPVDIVACGLEQVYDIVRVRAHDYNVEAMSVYKVGEGFGARLEVLLIFRARS